MAPRLFLQFALMSCLVGTGSHAHESPASNSRFSVHDLNHDGLIDRHEYEQLLRHRRQHQANKSHKGRRAVSSHEFADIDLDADGYISEEELVKMLNHQLRLQRRYRAREGRWSE